MNCPKCSGLMIFQKFYAKHESHWSWHCYFCGSLYDDVIESNRSFRQPIRESSTRKSGTPKISDCPDEELFIESSLDDLVSKYGINNYAPIYRERTRRVGLNEVPEEILRKYKNRKGKAVHKSRKVVKKRVLPESKNTK